MTLPTLPDPMTLPALQDYVARMVAARGFYKDPNKIFILLTEEVGELAKEFKHRAYYPSRFDLDNLGFELADILLYLLDLANGQGQQLMARWPAHEVENDRRFAPQRGSPPPAAAIEPTLPLNGLVAHVETKRQERGFEDTPENLMILLTEEVGEIATELRKLWKNQGSPKMLALEIIDALTYVMRLAKCFGIDLENAVRIKEARNAGREWNY